LGMQASLIKYGGEGLFYSGILFTINKQQDEALVPGAVAIAILARFSTKFLGRVGFWDFLRGLVLPGYNDMNRKRDLIGRISSTMAWCGPFAVFIVFCIFVACLCGGLATDSFGSVLWGKDLARPVTFPSLLVAAAMMPLCELMVAFVAWRQQRATSELTLLQTFLRMSEPGMQVVLGNGKGCKNSRVCIVDEPEDKVEVSICPCGQVPVQLVCIVMSVLTMCILGPINAAAAIQNYDAKEATNGGPEGLALQIF